MKTLKTLLIIAVLGGAGYFAYDYLNSAETTSTLTLTDGQEIFGKAFLSSQETTVDLSKTYDVDIALSVEDNENDVLPAKLEQLSGSIYLDYDFTNELDASAETIVDFFLNGADFPNFAFMASLKEKAVSFTLVNFDTEAGIFLGLDELLGSAEEIEALADLYVGKTQNIALRDSDYREIVNTLTHAQEDSELVVNTAEEEQAILQSFVDENVITITSIAENAEGYLLDFEADSQAVIDFLNAVAQINGVDADFSNELPMLEQISLSGQTQIGPDQEFKTIEGDLLVERSLIDSAQKDLLFHFAFSFDDNESEFAITLLDSVKNTEQAEFTISIKES